MDFGDSVRTVFEQIQRHPALLDQLTLSKIYSFILHTARLRNDILLAQPSSIPLSSAPEFLPRAIQGFLSDLLGLSNGLVLACWSVFKNLIWRDDFVSQLQQNVEDGFRLYGINRGLSEYAAGFVNAMRANLSLLSLQYLISSQYALCYTGLLQSNPFEESAATGGCSVYSA